MTYPIAESREIAAPAEAVWALVADLPRMGEHSPENMGGRWTNGATGPALGAVFAGANRNGVRRWSTKATVVDCSPGTSFEIAISSGPIPIANWRYEFEERPEGCRVTESWADHRKLWMRVVTRPLGSHDATHARSEMAATLTNLAAALEQ
jgi:ligand-binding SRPBCC domain-containing protein